MSDELEKEMEILRGILYSVGQEMPAGDAASEEEISEVEAATGIRFDAQMREFYRTVNGSQDNLWFAVFSDQPTPCAVFSLSEAFEEWKNENEFDIEGEDTERDARIQPGIGWHPLWFPIAEFNGMSTCVFYDANPTDKGRYGQIIVYQHDPDAVYFVADDFLTFFRKSNELMRENAGEFFSDE